MEPPNDEELTAESGVRHGWLEKPTSFDDVIQQLSVFDAQNLLEILVDYLEDGSCWVYWYEDYTCMCLWCRAYDKTWDSTTAIVHAKGCPIAWLQKHGEMLTGHLHRLPRLEIHPPTS